MALPFTPGAYVLALAKVGASHCECHSHWVWFEYTPELAGVLGPKVVRVPTRDQNHG